MFDNTAMKVVVNMRRCCSGLLPASGSATIDKTCVVPSVVVNHIFMTSTGLTSTWQLDDREKDQALTLIKTRTHGRWPPFLLPAQDEGQHGAAMAVITEPIAVR